ncbi:hypothetical protein M0Q50_05365 [bacterium]|jgi:hypothetical protein|nr:hypothetical protein [bacterium]
MINISIRRILSNYFLISGQNAITYKELKELTKQVELILPSYYLQITYGYINEAKKYFGDSMEFSDVDIKLLDKKTLLPYKDNDLCKVFEKVIQNNIRKKKLMSLL